MTTIRYFIPEDGDEECYPNVFLAPKPRQAGAPPSLGQVKEAFPLPGTYHFRFKSPLYPGGDRDKGAIPVWMDTINDSQYVPTWKNTIVAKVTRINMDEEDDDDDVDFVAGRGMSTPAPAAGVTTTPPAAPSSMGNSVPRAPLSHGSSSIGSADHLDIFGDTTSPAPAPVHHHHHHPSSSSGGGTANLLDGHHHHSTPAAPVSSGAPSSNLLDMDGFGGPAQPPSTAHNDFLGMTATTGTTNNTPMGPTGGYSNLYGQPASQSVPQQQQQQQQQPQRPPQPQQNVFDSFSNQQGPFGGLGTPWK